MLLFSSVEVRLLCHKMASFFFFFRKLCFLFRFILFTGPTMSFQDLIFLYLYGLLLQPMPLEVTMMMLYLTVVMLHHLLTLAALVKLS